MEHSKIKSFAKFINKLSDWIGRLVCVLILPMIAILLYEVIMRYVFDRPTIWAHETSGMLYTVYFLLGGAYTLRWGGHIQIEFLYIRFSPRTRAIVDCFTWTFFYLFCGVILWKGIPFTWDSISVLETSSTPFAPPIWPIKIFIPVSAVLFLLQGIVRSLEMFITAFTGQEANLLSPESGN